MREITPENLDKLLDLVNAENRRQIGIWGLQDLPAYTWLTILQEETGEIAQAVLECARREDRIHVVDESIQAATLVLKIAKMYLEKDQLVRSTKKDNGLITDVLERFRGQELKTEKDLSPFKLVALIMSDAGLLANRIVEIERIAEKAGRGQGFEAYLDTEGSIDDVTEAAASCLVSLFFLADMYLTAIDDGFNALLTRTSQ